MFRVIYINIFRVISEVNWELADSVNILWLSVTFFSSPKSHFPWRKNKKLQLKVVYKLEYMISSYSILHTVLWLWAKCPVRKGWDDAISYKAVLTELWQTEIQDKNKFKADVRQKQSLTARTGQVINKKQNEGLATCRNRGLEKQGHSGQSNTITRLGID